MCLTREIKIKKRPSIHQVFEMWAVVVLDTNAEDKLADPVYKSMYGWTQCRFEVGVEHKAYEGLPYVTNKNGKISKALRGGGFHVFATEEGAREFLSSKFNTRYDDGVDDYFRENGRIARVHVRGLIAQGRMSTQKYVNGYAKGEKTERTAYRFRYRTIVEVLPS